MERRDEPTERQPLPSEDEGDLLDEPATGETDDALVAAAEGVPWVPPTERVIRPEGVSHDAAEVAGGAASDEEELELEEGEDEPLLVRALEALRSSDVTAGDRIQVDAAGSTIWVRGEVESLEVADEIIGILGDLDGVDEVVDELETPSGSA
jgi:hypothetical protein